MRKRPALLRELKIPSHSRHLMVVDSRRIRAKAGKAYEKAKRDLATARTDIELFDKKDLPEYQAWLHRELGPLLTQAREFARLSGEKEHLISLVLDCAFEQRVPLPIAYEMVMAALNAPPPEPLPRPESSNSGRPPHSKSPFLDEDVDPEFGEDPFAAFEQMFEEMFGHRSPPPRSARPVPAKPVARPRVKELYRALARKLHPDAQTKMTPQKLEYWHQAQAAYERGDEEQLEVILTLLEVEEKGTATASSVSLLMRITDQVKRALRQVKTQVRDLKKNPAWKFTSRDDIPGFKARIEREIQAELEIYKRRLADTSEQIRGWEDALAAIRARKFRSPRPRKTRVFTQQDQFWF